MSLHVIGLLVGGLVLLIVGAEALVRGAARLAARAGVSPLVIGLTVVAFGTSAPETTVGVKACLAGQGDIALGNVIGSNVCNLLLILGLAAVVAPLRVSRQLVRVEVPIMVAASALAYAFAWDGAIDRTEGVVLFALVLAYVIYTVRTSRQAVAATPPPITPDPAIQPPIRQNPVLDLALIALGLGMLVLGSDWLVAGAVSIAREWQISELVIGLTIIAVGTSLPELATSVLATLRGQREIAVGNVVGSNIFNLLCVLGLSGISSPAPIRVSPSLLGFDLPVMCIATALCLPAFYTGYRIARWEGAVFLGGYVAYTAHLLLSAAESPHLDTLHTAGRYGLPALGLLFVYTWIQAVRRGDSPDESA